MKARFALILLGVLLIAGCHGYVHLYPVQGPLASLTPPPVYIAKISLVANWSKPMTFGVHAMDAKGKIAVVLDSGESFNGTWQIVYGKAGANGGAAAANSLADAWDTVYGKGYYVAHVLGMPLFAHTEMTGSKGTVLTVEWYEWSSSSPGEPGDQQMVGKGIAKDSKGNVYKLVF